MKVKFDQQILKALQTRSYDVKGAVVAPVGYTYVHLVVYINGQARELVLSFRTEEAEIDRLGQGGTSWRQ